MEFSFVDRSENVLLTEKERLMLNENSNNNSKLNSRTFAMLMQYYRKEIIIGKECVYWILQAAIHFTDHSRMLELSSPNPNGRYYHLHSLLD